MAGPTADGDDADLLDVAGDLDDELEDDELDDDELDDELAGDDPFADDEPATGPEADDDAAEAPAAEAPDDDLVSAVVDEDDDAIEGLREGEFVCRGCYMAKRETQLADAKRRLCRDCA